MARALASQRAKLGTLLADGKVTVQTYMADVNSQQVTLLCPLHIERPDDRFDSSRVVPQHAASCLWQWIVLGIKPKCIASLGDHAISAPDVQERLMRPKV